MPVDLIPALALLLNAGFRQPTSLYETYMQSLITQPRPYFNSMETYHTLMAETYKKRLGQPYVPTGQAQPNPITEFIRDNLWNYNYPGTVTRTQTGGVVEEEDEPEVEAGPALANPVEAGVVRPKTPEEGFGVHFTWSA
jgi:hypothetical protein